MFLCVCVCSCSFFVRCCRGVHRCVAVVVVVIAFVKKNVVDIFFGGEKGWFRNFSIFFAAISKHTHTHIFHFIPNDHDDHDDNDRNNQKKKCEWIYILYISMYVRRIWRKITCAECVEWICRIIYIFFSGTKHTPSREIVNSDFLFLSSSCRFTTVLWIIY